MSVIDPSMAYICLSYTITSRDLAEQVHQRLEANDIRIWRREPDLPYDDAESAAILEAAFRGAAAFVFVWGEQEDAPTYLTNDYYAAQKLERPIYFVKNAGQINKLIAALRQMLPQSDNFGPLPALASDRDYMTEEASPIASGAIMRVVAIGAALLALITVIAIFSLSGRDEFAGGILTPRSDLTATIAASEAAPTEALAVVTDEATATETSVPSATWTPTATATPEATLTSSSTPTATMTLTRTPTNTATATATATLTRTPTNTATATDTATPTDTLTPSQTPAPLLIPQATDTRSPIAPDPTLPTPFDQVPLFSTNTPLPGTQATLESKPGG